MSSRTASDCEGAARLSWILSPCIEWLYGEGGRPFDHRVRMAAEAGFTCVEFWGTSDKDVGALETAIRETGVTVEAFVSQPRGRLVDPATHAEFLAGIEVSCRIAGRLDARNLIVVAGDTIPGVDFEVQRHAVAEALRRAAAVTSPAGIGLLLEPLNTRVDHPGYFLDSTADALHVIREAGEPSVRLLYDLYHSIVMGEDPATVLKGSGQLVGHVHIADVPGRHEPGTGDVDWPRQLSTLRSVGYAGSLGLEFIPSRDTEASLGFIRRAVDQAWAASIGG